MLTLEFAVLSRGNGWVRARALGYEPGIQYGTRGYIHALAITTSMLPASCEACLSG